MRLNLATLLVMATGTNAALTSTQVVDNIKDITQSSTEVNDVAKSLTYANVFDKGARNTNICTTVGRWGFRDIISTVSKYISAMGIGRRSVNIFPNEEDAEPAQRSATSKRQIDQPDNGQNIKVRDAAMRGRAANKRQDAPADGEEEEGADMRRRAGKKRQEGGENGSDPDEADELANDPEGADMRRRTGKKRQDPGYPDDEQSKICDAFRTFVKVHQALLSTVISKHGLLSQTQFTQPIAAALKQLESGVDTLAFGIIDLVPTCAEGATEDKNKLDDTLQDAETAYANWKEAPHLM